MISNYVDVRSFVLSSPYICRLRELWARKVQMQKTREVRELRMDLLT